MIAFKCQSCGKTLRTKADEKRVQCENCQSWTTVPPVEMVKAPCPACSKPIVLPVAHLGQPTKCEHCNKLIIIKMPNKSRTRKTAKDSSKDNSALLDALDSLNDTPELFSTPPLPIQIKPEDVSRQFPIDRSTVLPIFEFKATTKSGSPINGRLQAQTIQDAAKKLRLRGFSPEPDGILEISADDFDDFETPDDSPSVRTDVGMAQKRPCPYCGESILRVAKKCKHCGEWLDVKPTNESDNVSQSLRFQNRLRASNTPTGTASRRTAQRDTHDDPPEHEQLASQPVTRAQQIAQLGCLAIIAIPVIIGIAMYLSYSNEQQSLGKQMLSQISGTWKSNSAIDTAGYYNINNPEYDYETYRSKLADMKEIIITQGNETNTLIITWIYRRRDDGSEHHRSDHNVEITLSTDRSAYYRDKYDKKILDTWAKEGFLEISAEGTLTMYDARWQR